MLGSREEGCEEDEAFLLWRHTASLSVNDVDQS